MYGELYKIHEIIISNGSVSGSTFVIQEMKRYERIGGGGWKMDELYRIKHCIVQKNITHSQDIISCMIYDIFPIRINC